MKPLVRVKALVLAVALVFVWCVPQARADEKKSLEISAKLNKRITLEKGIDANTPLRDALEHLASEKFGSIPIVIDMASFEEQGLREVDTQPVKLPRLTNVKLGDVLRLLLSELSVPGTYWIRNDHLEIISANKLIAYLGIDPAEYVPPVIYAKFDNQPLESVLQEIAEESGLTIIVDPKVGEKAATGVKAYFKNVMVSTAVRLLADMADLKSVRIDNVFYVTTKANAAALQAEQEKRKPKKPQPATPMGASAPKPEVHILGKAK